MTGLLKYAGKKSRQEKGLTLLEVVISVALLSIILLSFTNLFSNNFAASIQTGRITQAAALAQEKMEELLSCSYDELLHTGAGANGVPFALDDFDGFFCSYNIIDETLELDGYPVDGLRLEVVILQGEEKQVAKFTSFVHKGF